MSNHIGEVGKRIELTVTLVREYRFESYFGYNQTTTIYTMEDADRNILVWKTNGYMWLETVNARGDIDTDFPRKGDEVTIRATVKEHGEYKGSNRQFSPASRLLASSMHRPRRNLMQPARRSSSPPLLTEISFGGCHISSTKTTTRIARPSPGASGAATANPPSRSLSELVVLFPPAFAESTIPAISSKQTTMCWYVIGLSAKKQLAGSFSRIFRTAGIGPA